MFTDTSRPVVLPEPRSIPFAKLYLLVGIWLSGLSLLLYLAIFIWASGRGYDFSDEAYDLVLISDPPSYIDPSEFGQIWHPLYAVLGGSLAWFRIAGLAVLSACAALFGFSVWRFVRYEENGGSACTLTVLATVACVAWQHEVWKATPDYNMLNFCAVLIFFSGLLYSARYAASSGALTIGVRGVVTSAILCGIGVSLMVLTKATTALLSSVLGLVWLVALRPQRSLSSLALAGLIAASLLGAAMIATHGSISGFIANKFRALEILKALTSGTGDLHGIKASVLVVFSKETWKLASALAFASVPFALGLAWSWLLTVPRGGIMAKWLAVGGSILLAVIVARWRQGDMQYRQEFTAIRMWHLVPALVLLALALRVLWMAKLRLDEQGKRTAAAAVLLAAAPVAYAFGTNTLLVWKLSEAAIFWVASMMLVASLAPTAFRDRLLAAIALLSSFTALGLLTGTMIAPGRIGAPLWEQTRAVYVGGSSSRVEVGATAAAYVTTFQRDAAVNGFTRGTPIIDLSEMGPGLAFALGGKALGNPPWLIADGFLLTAAERLADVKSHAQAVPQQLRDVPRPELRRAWIITGAPAYFNIVKSSLISQNLGFPERYHVVSLNSRSDFGWTQTLWKPLD